MVIKLFLNSSLRELPVIGIQSFAPRILFNWPLCGVQVFDLDKNKIMNSRSRWKCINLNEMFVYWITHLNQESITPKLRKRINYFLTYGK